MGNPMVTAHTSSGAESPTTPDTLDLVTTIGEPRLPRSGARPGAGRKVGSGRWGEATQVVRLPVSRILTVKELDTQGPTPCLRAHHPDFAPIILRPGQELQIWGVVGGVVRRLP